VVSILFADLVGFTSLSEQRDPEEVRDLLTRYFDICRKLIARYGGLVEKFIGDAVMAVWGTPVAKEDDSERAVRAALELTASVAALGSDVGAPQLRARAGVLTGEAAVNIGAQGQGMVAGDPVNTASRIQAAAPSGEVYVGEITKRATEAAIEYEDAGFHVLKGKTEPIPLWRALRVVAGAGGALRSSVLEAPFVGRDRELRLIKDLFHGAAEDRKAHLVSVVGIAGIGKTRLSWEFEKYIDGLAADVWWHRGRCLSYGEGVAYWALAEMVKMRCEIVEDEDPASASEKLRAAIQEHIPDPEERRWVEPRLRHLLGLEERPAGDQENLFSAWRILFERLADRQPTVMVFEDMQWADAGLLDFIEYLLDWSRNHPLFILTLARPELADRRPDWGVAKRSFTSLYLEPLSTLAMEDLMTGLVPGLPPDLRGSILQRAEGVPLYAVETVRMLLDRGLLVREGNAYRPAAPIDTLEVPESLHSLIAARLDALAPQERRVVQDGSVLGKTFTKPGIRALTGLPDDELETLLSSLVRKEILSLQADPRSPERGQYGFLQDLVKKVAYETLSRKERKTKHVAAASFIESTWAGDEDEIVEVVAAHYLDAYREFPDAADAGEIKGKASGMLIRAGERAASLGATVEAQRAFEQAGELTEDPLARAALHERAGMMAWQAVRWDEAASQFLCSMALFESQEATHPAARVSARLADVTWQQGRLEEGLESMDRAFQILAVEDPDEDFAWLAAQLGRLMYFSGDIDTAAQRIETALDTAEALGLPEILSQALNTKALILNARGRWKESGALLRYALDLALDHDMPSAALRAYNNLADLILNYDQYQDALTFLQDGLVLARKVGNRFWEWFFLGQIYPKFALGKWDEALAQRRELPTEWKEIRGAIAQGFVGIGTAINVHRGELDEAESIVRHFAEMEVSADVQEQAEYGLAKATLLLARGNLKEALSSAERVVEKRDSLTLSHEAVKESFVVAVQAAFELNDLGKVEELLTIVAGLPPATRSQFLQAHALRFRARMADGSGDADRIEPDFKAAAGLFREMAVHLWLAVTLLEHGEWLVAHGKDEEAHPLVAEAREIFERLRARPWLDRLERGAGRGRPVRVGA
jgi:class 3 adenylate cyclase/tetratricopeptide (TPR) repeat protein